MHPARPVDIFFGFIILTPVTQHDTVTAGTQLSRGAPGNHVTVFIDNFDLNMRMNTSNRCDTFFKRIVRSTLKTDRTGLGHAVGNGHLGHIHFTDDLAHDLNRAGGTGHDAGPQVTEVKAVEIRMLQFCNKHGWHTMQGCTGLLAHRFKHGEWLKSLRRKDHCRAMTDTRQHTQHHAKTVIKRHRNAEAVLRGKTHRLTRKVSVIQNVKMRQGCAFR